jgi:hypothetical protein
MAFTPIEETKTTSSFHPYDTSSGTFLNPNESAAVLGHSNGLSLSGFAKGVVKSGVETLQSANVLDTMKGMAGQPQLKDITGVDPNKVTEAQNESEKAGKIIGTGVQMLAPMLGARQGMAAAGSKVLEKTGIKGFMESRAQGKVIAALTPKMTPSELEEAAKSGQTVKSMFGTPKVDMTKNKQFMKTAETVKDLVKGKSSIEDVNSVRNALSKEAETLQARVKSSDHPYTFKELQTALSNVEEPISLRGTAFEKQIKPIKQAAMDIAKKNGGTVSSLFDSRKEFDALVDRTYPNLYESESAPMRNAITGIRRAMNDFIEANLPEGSGFKDSLEKQKTYYDAIDYIATKVPEEVKKGSLLKRTVKNPLFQMGATAIGASALTKESSKILGD